MDSPQLPAHFDGGRIQASAKAKEVFARCVTEIEKVDAPIEEQDVARPNTVASRLNAVAVSEGESPRRCLELIACRFGLS